MKAAIVWFALAVLAGCSVSHKSQEFACTHNTDCAGHPGTVCDNGFCVVQGSIDAPMPKGDAPRGDAPGNNCPTGCTSCNVQQKTCTIDCLMSGANCDSNVQCPAGYHCDIKCDTDGACKNGVSCVGGASCTVECSGGQSCRNVECGTGPCDVTCSGTSSCRGVSCNNSCACDVLCTGTQSCQAGSVTCTSLLCGSGPGCTSVPAGCHSCM